MQFHSREDAYEKGCYCYLSCTYHSIHPTCSTPPTFHYNCIECQSSIFLVGKSKEFTIAIAILNGASAGGVTAI